jgi:hypothetical protein
MTIGLIANTDGSGAVQLGGINAISLDTSLNATMAGYVNAPNTFGFKNRFINGGMIIDQRNNGATLTLTAATSGYSVDRFRTVNQTDGTITTQRSTTAPTGFINSVLVTVTAIDTGIGATQYANVEQRIEGLNIADFNWGTASAAPITVSFWVRSSIIGTYCVGFGNSGGTRSYVAQYTINIANTWEQKTITVPGDTSGTWLTTNDIGLLVSFTLAVGSTYQQAAGAWGSTSFAIGTSSQTNLLENNGATFYITGVQLEKGSTATSFDFRDYGRELIMCQRYWQSFTNTAGLQYGPFAEVYTGNGAAGGVERNITSLPVTMRDVLTISRVGTWSVSNCGQPTLTTLGLSSFRTSITVTAAGAAAASPGAGTGWTANAEL